MNDGAQVALDWTVGEKQLGDDSKTPVLVVLHGLTGGSHESYIQGVLEKVGYAPPPISMVYSSPFTQVIQAPHYYRGVVMHSRGCGFTEITTPHTINGASTNDLRQILVHIRSKLAPGTPMVGIGFSLGSNILVKVVKETSMQ